MTGNLYLLPTMVANRYMFNRVIMETGDTVVYGAVQKNIQRNVVVETLRPELMDDPAKVEFFLETARLQANVGDTSMGSSLELFFADNTWHYAREQIEGESLESLLASGGKLTSASTCELMIQLCRSCVYMEMMGVDNAPFNPGTVYVMGSSLRYDNPIIAGQRSRSATRKFLTAAATLLPSLLDMESTLADKVLRQLEMVRFNANWSRLEPLHIDEKFIRLQLLIMKERRTTKG